MVPTGDTRLTVCSFETKRMPPARVTWVDQGLQ
jgi:hypothetical protein